jgi:hypothetical protein
VTWRSSPRYLWSRAVFLGRYRLENPDVVLIIISNALQEISPLPLGASARLGYRHSWQSLSLVVLGCARI